MFARLLCSKVGAAAVEDKVSKRAESVIHKKVLRGGEEEVESVCARQEARIEIAIVSTHGDI